MQYLHSRHISYFPSTAVCARLNAEIQFRVSPSDDLLLLVAVSQNVAISRTSIYGFITTLNETDNACTAHTHTSFMGNVSDIITQSRVGGMTN